MNAMFNDMSVRAKLTVMALFIVVLTAGLGLYGLVLLSGNASKTENLQTGVLHNADVVAAYQDEVMASISNLYRLTSTAANESDTTKIEAMSKTTMADFDKLITDVPVATTAMTAAGLPQNDVTAFASQVKAYAKRGKEIADMVTADVATASGMMTGTRQRYEAMVATLDNLTKTQTDRKRETLTAIASDMHRGQIIFIFSLAIIIAMAVTAALVLGKRISAPLSDMTDVVTALAEGNLDVTVPDSGRQDEVGKLANATGRLRERLHAAEQDKCDQVQLIVGSIGTGLDSLAKGDLTARISAELTGPFAKLKEDFNHASARLEDTLKKILQNTSAISTGASEISHAADDLSRRTEQQAASLEETAAALEEITSTVKKSAASARDARSRATTAKAAAENGGQVVGTAVNAMAEIEQSSKKITDIIGVIDEIAFQTNLLALNAGVEAARAGEAGKGFAVVASEVRALAQRSSDAAKQIKALINASGEQVNNGVRYVGETGTALERIIAEIEAINAFVTEMAKAAEHQATGIQEVNAAVGQMDQVTQQNAAMVEESTAASRTLAHETEELTEIIGFFQVSGVEKRQQAPSRRRHAA